MSGREIEPEPESDGAEFVQLFTKHQRRLYLFCLAQVPSPVDAEEILQNANIVIWRKFGEFQPGTNFFAWACRIARYEVLKFRERQGREKLRFSDEFVRQIADEAETSAELMEDRRSALAECMKKLTRKDRDLIQRRYAPGVSGKSLAESLGRPVNAVYQSLGRIRRVLLECITRRLEAAAS